MRTETRRSRYEGRTVLLLALPCAIIALSLMVWVTALSHSSFWADDFLWITHFDRSLGNPSDYHFNIGKYIINVFWALGTEAFGNGSVLPFLMLNSLVFAGGVILWLWTGVRERWTTVGAWWIAGVFIATAAWLPTTLWASNITHSGGFLALGAGIFAHRHAMSSHDAWIVRRWSALSGIAWTLAVSSNLLYIGLVVIAAYCAWHQFWKLRHLETPALIAGLTVCLWNLALPFLYFILIGYPGATASSPYAKTGLRFVRENLHFYRTALAPTDILTALYVALLLAGATGALIAARRRDFFPLAVLVAAAATALPALVQSQQRYVNYMAMPLLLLFSALATGLRPTFSRGYKRMMYPLILGAGITLLLVFHQGEEIRAYFTRTPFGSSLASFRSEVASLTPEGAAICVALNLDAQQEMLFIAEISGENGFRVPPIGAAHVVLVPKARSCPISGSSADITVSVNPRGNFVASG
jgi:hypothetical protein